MNNELLFVIKPWQHLVTKCWDRLRIGILFLPCMVLEFLLVVVFFTFHPIEFIGELKIRVKHLYWRRWRNTWLFMRGKYDGEFDPIFNLDSLAMSKMTLSQREKYQRQIMRRRRYVHEKFLRKSE